MLCGCGCGKETKKQFLQGHNKRKYRLPARPCACGCGEVVDTQHTIGIPRRYQRGHGMSPKQKRERTIEERFWPFVQKTAGCWLWIKGKEKAGYGIMRRPGELRQTKAHRVSWELHYGPIPEGRYILHHCDNPPCVNPEHLFLGTIRMNSLDMMAKGRGKGQFRKGIPKILQHI